jgi:DNA polymerase alpha subunit B
MAEAELHEFFSPSKPLEADVLSELQSIMRLHNLSAQDLFFKWESYCIKMDIDAQTVSLQAIRNLKQTIQDALESSNSRKAHSKVTATPRPGGPRGGIGDVFGVLDGLLPNTPASTGGKLGNRGAASTVNRKADHVGSSPATSGMRDQLKSMDVNGTP